MERRRPFFLKHRFHDLDDFTEAIRHWHLDFRQLDRGRFTGDLLQVGRGTVQMVRFRFNRRLDQWGTPPTSMRTMGIPADPDQRFVWRGQEVTNSKLFIYPLGGELESISPPGFDIFALSVSEEHLVEISQTAGLPKLPDMTGAAEVVTVGDSSMLKHRQTLHRLYREIVKRPLKPDDPAHRHALETRIPVMLFQMPTPLLTEPYPPPKLIGDCIRPLNCCATARKPSR